jgi:hypothetical protein
MRVVVESFLKMGVLGELDTDTGELTPLPPDAPVTRDAAQGTYMKLGREMAVLYASAGELVLRVGDDVAGLGQGGADDTTKIALEGEGLRRLTVEKNGETLIAHQYANPVNPPMELDLTMAEEEDFDLGLFATHVQSSDKRRRFQLRKWGR